MNDGALRRDTIATLLAQASYRVSGFALLMVLSRSLPPADIGAFFFAVAFAESFILLSHFGLNAVMARRVAASPERAADWFAPVIGFRLLSAPLYLLAVMTAAALFTATHWALALAAAVVVLCEDVYFSFGTLFLALRKATFNVAIGVAIHTVYVIVFLVAMWGAPSLAMLAGVSIVRAVGLAAAAVWVTRSRLFVIRRTWDWGGLMMALPFVWIGALQIVRDQAGTLFLGALAGNEAVAHFNLAWRLVAAAYFVPTAVGAVVVPLLSARGLTPATTRLLWVSAVGITLAGSAGGAVAWFLAAPLSSILYGPLGTSVEPLVRALAVVFPIGFLALFLSLSLQALYEEAHVLGALAVVTAANLAGNWFLVPSLGALGAVYALMLSALLQLGILLWRLRSLHLARR